MHFTMCRGSPFSLPAKSIVVEVLMDAPLVGPIDAPNTAASRRAILVLVFITSVHHNDEAERAPMPAFRRHGSRLCW